jgi:hypothetical protein
VLPSVCHRSHSWNTTDPQARPTSRVSGGSDVSASRIPASYRPGPARTAPRRCAIVHRTRPRPPLSGRQCGHGLHAKVPPTGLRFFAHDHGAADYRRAGRRARDERRRQDPRGVGGENGATTADDLTERTAPMAGDGVPVTDEHRSPRPPSPHHPPARPDAGDDVGRKAFRGLRSRLASFWARWESHLGAPLVRDSGAWLRWHIDEFWSVRV